MKTERKTNPELRRALRDTVPVIAGYLVLGTGFGIIMQSSGLGLLPAFLMSLFIYAGSMQYAAVGLLTGGASLLTVALTTLAVNARHLFYGVSMVGRYREGEAKDGVPGRLRRAYMIFALTDETYSLVCREDAGESYCFYVSLLDHGYWLAGTMLGALLGRVLPFDTRGVDFALTALFLTVFTDQWMKEKRHYPALAGLILTAASLLLFGRESFLLPAMGLIALALLPALGKEEKHD